MKTRAAIVLVTLLTLIFFSCNSKTEMPETNETADQTFEQGNIKITDAWIRPGAAGMNTAFFFNVTNSSDMPDTLVAAESGIAEIVEIHETYEKGDDMMGMRSVEEVVIPANSTFEFKPMHHHVMLIKVINDLKIDDEATVNLKFKNTGDIKITAKAIDMKTMKH
jgi:copper(I)-binding protein